MIHVRGCSPTLTYSNKTRENAHKQRIPKDCKNRGERSASCRKFPRWPRKKNRERDLWFAIGFNYSPRGELKHALLTFPRPAEATMKSLLEN